MSDGYIVRFKFALGEKVSVPTDDDGTVYGVCCKQNGCSYLVVWWSDGKRNEEWLLEHELRN